MLISEHQEPYLAVIKIPKLSSGKLFFPGNMLENIAGTLCFPVHENLPISNLQVEKQEQKLSLGHNCMV